MKNSSEWVEKIEQWFRAECRPSEPSPTKQRLKALAWSARLWLPGSHAVAEPVLDERGRSTGEWHLGVSPDFFTEARWALTDHADLGRLKKKRCISGHAATNSHPSSPNTFKCPAIFAVSSFRTESIYSTLYSHFCRAETTSVAMSSLLVVSMWL